MITAQQIKEIEFANIGRQMEIRDRWVKIQEFDWSEECPDKCRVVCAVMGDPGKTLWASLAEIDEA